MGNALTATINRYKFEQFVQHSTAEEQTAMQTNIVLAFERRKKLDADMKARTEAEATQ